MESTASTTSNEANAALQHPDNNSTDCSDASSSQLPIAETPPSEILAELLAAESNAYAPTTMSEKLYFHCFALQILLRIMYIIMSQDCMGCFVTATEECAHTCEHGVGAFMRYVRDNFYKALNAVETNAVRLDFGTLQARFPEISDLSNGQLNVCEFRCRSAWRAALYHYLNANYKRYPESWLRTFTPDDLDNIPAPTNLYINVGTGVPYFISSKTGKKKIGCGEQRSD